MWQEAINNHKILIKERPGYQDWSTNIIDATRCLQNFDDWKKFYSYLTQAPKYFNSNSQHQTLQDLDVIPDIPPYPTELTTEIFCNGNEEIIYVNAVQPEQYDVDDEKIPE